ncbi:hypothetical protein RF11_15625 [Thelohanellus kitauei]|uniref:Uncharacterized protein n=1 Tax=Thelohanellus kitauei TaxID=669202 RepID=A0A0C2JWR9_THEKT|nr:hypothetical protein RF11_15625 [Thelohanellus kitauei]
MKAFYGFHTSCMLFAEILLRQLSSNIRLPLSDAKFDDFNALLEYDDEIFETEPREFLVYAKLLKVTLKASVPVYPCCYQKKFGSNALECLSTCAFTMSEKTEKRLRTYRILVLRALIIDTVDEIMGIPTTCSDR